MSKKYIESDFLTGIESILAARLSTSAWLVTSSLLALVGALLVWAWLAEVDVVSPAPGEVIPSARVQLIQPKELGVIADIKVKDGDAVNGGQLLVQLDDSLLMTELEQVRQEVVQLRLQLLRLTAMQQCLAGRACSRNLPEQVDIDSHQQSQIETLYWLQWQHYRAQVELRKQRLAVAQSERNRQSQEVINAEQMMPFYVRRDQRMQAMVKDDFAAESEVEEARENRLLQEQQLNSHKMELHGVSARVKVTERELNAYRREYREQVHSQWFETQFQLSAKEKEALKLQRYIAEKRLSSPIDGIIYDSAVVTRSGVVQSGEVLMKVVPKDVELEVAIKIANKDIGFVAIGDKVKVKIDAYNFTKHGSIAGVISHISEAAVLDEQLGPVYPATVRIERSDISVNGKQAVIIPGMTAVVDIYQGKRLLAEYVLAPLLRYKDEALRER